MFIDIYNQCKRLGSPEINTSECLQSLFLSGSPREFNRKKEIFQIPESLSILTQIIMSVHRNYIIYEIKVFAHGNIHVDK